VNGTTGASNVVKTPWLSRKRCTPVAPDGIVGIIAIHTDDLAAIVEIAEHRSNSAGHVDGREPTLVPSVAGGSALRVEVAADDLTEVVDAGGHSHRGFGALPLLGLAPVSSSGRNYTSCFRREHETGSRHRNV
jgi:hypothetical protein